MEDRPLTGCKVSSPVRLAIDALWDYGESGQRHPKIVDKFIAKLCCGGDHIVTVPGAEAANTPPNRRKSAIPGLEIVDHLDDCARKRDGHGLAVNDKVWPEAIDCPFPPKPSPGRGQPGQRRAAQSKDR